MQFPAAWRYDARTRPVSADSGMVVSTDSLASAAGVEILRAGGNAVEAAIATSFALAVVNPEAGNVGGGGFMVARLADGTEFALDYREQAPGGATSDMYVDEQGRVTDRGVEGHLASGVPGTVAGLEAAYLRYGELPWARLLEPAIRLARDGFHVAERHHNSIRDKRELLSKFPTSAGKFLPRGEPPPIGSSFKQPYLARTLQAIADGGAAAFYEGWIADSLAAEMRRGGGLINRRDLAAYEAVWREPVRAEYRGYEVVSMPPASSGGTTLTQILNIMEGFDLQTAGWHSAEAIHLAVEAMRRAYADRNYYLGDTDFVDVPLAMLTSESYADSLRRSIDRDRASVSEEFNRVSVESENTTHVSVVDVRGNAVAVTTTLNSGFGSGVVVRGAGFLLNNEMDDFTSLVGVPNLYGLVQGEANAIAPGKRMLSAMTPTIVINPQGRTELVTGTPGGATIITTVFQIVTNHIDFGLPVQTSVNAPRFHHQHLPDVIRFEKDGLPASVVAELRSLGHEVSERTGISGNVESIYIAPDGTMFGAADPRRYSKAIGY
ncbi:MAG: gamma-glutamyltransferase [Gemmatimonadota bacterium]|nr:gamma-glutamyltransferase [Gemmatimonadota bacterium]